MHVRTLSGTRTDFSVESNDDKCKNLRKATGGECVPKSLRLALHASQGLRRKPLDVCDKGNRRCLLNAYLKYASATNFHSRTGLGYGRSGGSVLDVALAFCKHVDLFGAGLFSERPGTDVLYQHFYDSGFTQS